MHNCFQIGWSEVRQQAFEFRVAYLMRHLRQIAHFAHDKQTAV